MENLIPAIMAKYDVRACSITVARHGKIVSSTTYGATATALFQAASISKLVFAIGVLLLQQKRKINIDTDISKYLRDPVMKKRFKGLTFAQLLSHTAGTTIGGFPGYEKGDILPSTLDIVAGRGITAAVMPKYVPEYTSMYSGGGTMVAQLAVEDVVKTDLAEFMRVALFNPLKLRCTFKTNVDGVIGYLGTKKLENYNEYPESAAAGLWSCSKDLCIIGLEICKALKDQSTIITKCSAKRMISHDSKDEGDGDKVGLGCFLFENLFFHYGSNVGYSNKMSFTTDGTGCVIMANKDDVFAFLEEVEVALGLKSRAYDFRKKRKKPKLRSPARI